MKNNVFGYNKKPLIDYNNVTIITDNNNYTISTYMCPQDNCIKEIVKILDNSKEEILFATFAITHDEVSNKLIEKSLKDIEVIGIIEKRNFNLLGSDAKNLSNYFNLYNDTNKYNMHHKFFVIDKNIVITGSMNPSLNGDKYNDENILIIHNKEIAKMYRDEIFRLIE